MHTGVEYKELFPSQLTRPVLTNQIAQLFMTGINSYKALHGYQYNYYARTSIHLATAYGVIHILSSSMSPTQLPPPFTFPFAPLFLCSPLLHLHFHFLRLHFPFHSLRLLHLHRFHLNGCSYHHIHSDVVPG